MEGEKPKIFDPTPDEVLDSIAIAKLGGLTLASPEYKAYEKKAATAEAKTRLELLSEQLFTKKKDFLYERNRIKLIDQLCRDIRDVFLAGGIDPRDVNQFFVSEISPIIEQLTTLEKEQRPRPAQVYAEADLRTRLLSLAKSRYGALTKKVLDINNPSVRVTFDAALQPEVKNEAVSAIAGNSSVAGSDSYTTDKSLDQAIHEVRGDKQPNMTIGERTIEAIPVTSMSPESLKPVANNEVNPARAELDAFVAANAANRQVKAQARDTSPEQPVTESLEKKTGWWDKDFRDSKFGALGQTEDNVESSLASSETDSATRSVASLMAQADRLITLTRSRREKLDVSHKEAKAISDNYTAARSEIRKIKNRLKAILDGREVEKKSAEVAELRHLLAKHLWDLRKEFSVSGGDTTELTTNVAESKSAVSEELDELYQTANALLATLSERVTLGGYYTQPSSVDEVVTKQVTARNHLKGLLDRLRAMQALPPEELRQEELNAVATVIGEVEYELKQVPRVDATKDTPLTYHEPDLSVLPGNEWRATNTFTETAQESPHLKAGEAVRATLKDGREVDAEVEIVRDSGNISVSWDEGGSRAYQVVPLENVTKVASSTPSEVTPRNTAEDGIVRNFSDNTIVLDKDTLMAASDEFIQTVAAEKAVTEPLKNTEPIAPMRLLGLQVPTENDGPFAVRAFREALNIEWQPIKKAAEAGDQDARVKQAKFQEIFKLLSYVTEAGLSETEAEKLRALASEISSKERVVGELPVKRAASVENSRATVNPSPIDIPASSKTESTAESPKRRGIWAAFLSGRENALRDLRNHLPALAAVERNPKNDSEFKKRLTSYGSNIINALLVALTLAAALDNDKNVSASGGAGGGPQITATGPIMPSVGDIKTTVLPSPKGSESASVGIEKLYEFTGARGLNGEIIDTVSEAAYNEWQKDSSLIEKPVTKTQFLSGMWGLLAELEQNPTLEAQLTSDMKIASGDIDMVFTGNTNAIDLQPFYELLNNRLK